jgi:hypothetical protein
VLRLIDHVATALRESDDLDFVHDQTALLRDGGGAWRQRAAHVDRGRLEDVIDLLAVE